MIPDLGKPQRPAILVENEDGSKSQLPLVAIALFSDGSMQTIANIVSQVVAAELNARGLTPLAETAEA